MIHLGLHFHSIVDYGCKKVVDESKKLIEEEVNRTPIAKIFAISLSASKSFLAKHLFNVNGDNNCKVFKGHQLKEIQDKFILLSSSHVCNLVALFKNYWGGGYIDNIFKLKSKSRYNFIQECYFPSQISS